MKSREIKILFWFGILIIAITLIFNYKLVIVEKFDCFSNWLYPTNENRRGELFTTILSVLGAIGVLFGIYVSLRRAKAMEAGVLRQKETIEIQTKQIELSRKAQTDERFKNAIEHFGSSNEHIILGGIAELNQIAKDNVNEYAEIVFNIFCSYIRSNANIYKKTADDINTTAIQTIIDNISKFKNSYDNPYVDLKANLSHTNLLGINFDNSNLKGADLSFSYMPNLINVNLEGAHIDRCEFSVSNIINVNFKEAYCFKTFFHLSTLIDVDMSHLVGSMLVFVDSKLKNVNFDSNSLFEYNFISSEITKCSFEKTDILSSRFIGSNLKDCDFGFERTFSKNDFRLTGFDNVKVESLMMDSNFVGCQNTSDLRSQFKELIEHHVGTISDLSGLIIEDKLLYGCQFGAITKEDVDEMIGIYDEYIEMGKLSKLNH